jgi:hypothetical protein
MRDYGKISPQFWIGKTGKALRKHHEAQIVALYLMTCPTSEMTGVFNCPLMYIAHETGLGEEGASKGLERLVELDFCTYEEDLEVVFVHEMAKYQIGEELKVSDNQVKWVKKAFLNMPDGLIRRGFYEKYRDAFHLGEYPELAPKKEAPPKALRSQEQEQEQEQKQEQKQEHDQEHGCAPQSDAPPKAGKLSPEKQIACRHTWDSYASAYFRRYGAEPVRNAKVNRQIVDLVGRLGSVESPHVAAFYVEHNSAYYVREMHAVGALLKDAEKLRTEWATNTRMTSTRANQVDKTQTNYDAFAPLIAAAEAEEGHV